MSGFPSWSTRRPASVRAPLTDTCWPSTARNASSAPSTTPGTRRPGWRRTERAEQRIAPEHLVHGDGIGVEIQEGPAALDCGLQIAHVAEPEDAIDLIRRRG